MTTHGHWSLIALILLATPGLGCSDDASRTVPTNGWGTFAANGAGGAGILATVEPPTPADAGQAGAAGSPVAVMAPGQPCATSADCDDGKPCDGEEACVAGACTAGVATACGASLQCSDADGGTCVFTDTSPWIVYQADDDTPGMTEIYAIKRDLVGKMEPIKLNDELAPGWRAVGRGGWAPDHQHYAFGVVQMSPYLSAIEVVNFGGGLPSKPLRLDGAEDIEWAPSGDLFATDQQDGISIYASSSDGGFEEVFDSTNPANDDCYGHWTTRGEFVFTTTVVATKKSNIDRLAPSGSNWNATVLIQGINNLWHFEVSPTGDELTYEPQPSDAESPLYVLQIAEDSKPKVLAPAGDHSFSWSPDGSRFLLVKNTAEGVTQAFLGTGGAYTAKPVLLAPTELISSAWFTPDGKQVMLREPSYDWATDTRLLDPSKSTAYSYNTVGRSGNRDNGPVWAADNDLGVLPTREDLNMDARLTLFSLSGGDSDSFDSIPPDSEFGYVEISAHGEFVAYTKGVAPNYDGAYVDLRYTPIGDYKPIRLPGDGTVRNLGFDTNGTGLYYVREKDNGARECFFLDLSHQVAKDPVKISREGRVDYCTPQPQTH